MFGPVISQVIQFILRKPLTAIAAFAATGTLAHQLLKPHWVAYKESREEEMFEQIREKLEQTNPEIDASILWGPPGSDAENVDELEISSNSVEFLYLKADNESEEHTYLISIEGKYPDGFEILKDGDTRLDRSELGETKSFIDGLVGGGGAVSYRFLPSFGELEPSPPQIRHNRRRGVSGPIGPLDPGQTAMSPFWIYTPGPGSYQIDMLCRIWIVDQTLGEVRINNFQKSFDVQVGGIEYL